MSDIFGNSRPVSSPQHGVHRDLDKVVRRHAATPYRKPILDYNRRAFEAAIRAWYDWQDGSPLILDAGCGVGWSTLQLARNFPDHFVLGVDQSIDRLQRGKPLPIPDNAAFIRADLVDFWRLLHTAGIRLTRHYLLYPNPWPKTAHLQRRWHGHPVFPSVLALGGRLECRSNWDIYVNEFAQAVNLLTRRFVGMGSYLPSAEPLTPFEAKYLASGQTLYRAVSDLR